MTPTTDPKHLFGYVDTVKEEECFFCDEMISPDTDPTHIISTIPGKTLFATHYDCFHQMGWSMLYFVSHYTETTETVN